MTQNVTKMLQILDLRAVMGMSAKVNDESHTHTHAHTHTHRTPE